MRFALYLPNVGWYADTERVIEVSRAAEASGWDGVFLWDHLMLAPELGLPVADAWTVLTAVLTQTQRLIAGPLVTPLARRRPAKVAAETATLDRLSHGRLVLGAGLGAAADLEFTRFGEDGDPRRRAERLDEALVVIDGLWRGDELDFTGRHYRLTGARLPNRPVQRPRVPIWTAATWPHLRPLRRAARWDGVVPMVAEATGPPRGPSVTELSTLLRHLPRPLGSTGPDDPGADGRGSFDVAVPGVLAPDDPKAESVVRRYADVGATWWLESFDPWRRSPSELAEWVSRGPPGR